MQLRLAVVGIACALAVALARGSVVAAPQVAKPSVRIMQIPHAATGGTETLEHIAGTTSNAPPESRVVLYARGANGVWYVQPWGDDRRYTAINQNGAWDNDTHLGLEYAAVLVSSWAKGRLPNETRGLPALGDGILAIHQVAGGSATSGRGSAVAAPQVAKPSVRITQIPHAAPGGTKTLEHIAGTTSNAPPESRVVLYALGADDVWYVQPWGDDRRYTAINQNGAWDSDTHLGLKYAAVLVSSGAKGRLPNETGGLPALGDGILAIHQVPGRQ